MKKSIYTALAASVILAISGGISASAATTTLDEIYVDANKTVLPGGFVSAENRVGVLGNIDVIDVPFTQKQYTEKTIETFYDPNQPINGTLANNPSIRIGSPSPMYTDFSMRGVNMNAAHYYINGIPNMFNQTRSIPAYTLESVDIVSGPNTVLNGSTFSSDGRNGRDAPAGLLNGVTKRAGEEPLYQYTQRFSGRSTWTEDIDAGQRFGKNQEWGIRVMGHKENGELSMKGADIDDKTIYVDVDHKTEKSYTNIFAGYYDWRIDGGQRWLNAGSVKNGHLASASDGSTNLSFDGQTKYNHGTLFTLNHTQKMNDAWSWFVNGGYSHYSEHKRDPQSGSLTLDNDGKLKGQFRDYVSDSRSTYWQGGFSHHGDWGKVKNDLTLSLDYFNYKNKSLSVKSVNINGDIWNGVSLTGNPTYVGDIDSAKYSKETATGLTLADRAEFGKFSVYAAAQYRDSSYTASSGHKISKTSLNPSFALAYKPRTDLSIYTSYAESYTKPFEVTGGYANDGQIFDSIKNKQTEVGVKYEHGSLLHTIAYFDLNQGNYIIETLGGKNYYTQEGENRFKGFEYSVTGKIAPKWNVMGGFMYINGKREHVATTDKANGKEGKYVTGTPKWSGVFAAEYEANDDWSFIGRLNYVGESHVNDNGVKAPDYLLVDLGAKYKTKFGDVPVTWNLMCYNAFGKDYWISRGTSVALGAPRTFMLSASFDF